MALAKIRMLESLEVKSTMDGRTLIKRFYRLFRGRVIFNSRPIMSPCVHTMGYDYRKSPNLSLLNSIHHNKYYTEKTKFCF